MGTITIGGSVPADLAVGSVLATAFTLLTHAAPAVAVALALPISLLAVFVYQVLKLVYTALVEKYDALLEQGRDRAALGLTLGMTFFTAFRSRWSPSSASCSVRMSFVVWSIIFHLR